MAKCFCITSGCRDQDGVDIDIRTFKAHKVKDKAQLAQRASEATNCAIEEEVNVITSHLASQTLSDNVSGLPPTPAGHLWAKWTAEELPDAVDITAAYSSSHRSLMQNLLSHLGNFDLSVKVLHEKVALGLQISDSSPSSTLISKIGLEVFLSGQASKTKWTLHGIQLTSPSTACMIFLMEKCFVTSVDQMGSTSVSVVKMAVMFSLSVLIFSIHYPTNRLAKRCLLVSSLLSASIYPLSFDINLRICFLQASYPGLMNHL